MMDKLKNLFKEYSPLILVFVLICLFLKTCSSCQRQKHETQFMVEEHYRIIDSLNAEIDSLYDNNLKKDSLLLQLQTYNDALEENSQKTIKMLNENNKYMINKLNEKQ